MVVLAISNVLDASARATSSIDSDGKVVGDLKVGNATGGTNNTLIDVNTFRGGDDTYNGKLILVTDASDGTTQTTQYVNDYTASNNTIQFQQNASFTVASSDEYEIWDEPYNPDVIHDFINQAIVDATGQAYDPIEYPDMSSSPHTALFGDGRTLRFDIPSNISIINHIYYLRETFSIPFIAVSLFSNLFKITLFFTSMLITPENVPSLVSKEILFMLTFIEFEISEVISFTSPISSIPVISILALNS